MREALDRARRRAVLDLTKLARRSSGGMFGSSFRVFFSAEGNAAILDAGPVYGAGEIFAETLVFAGFRLRAATNVAVPFMVTALGTFLVSFPLPTLMKNEKPTKRLGTIICHTSEQKIQRSAVTSSHQPQVLDRCCSSVSFSENQ